MLFDFPSYSLILPGAGRRHVVDSGGDKVWVSAQFGGWRGLFALGTGGSAYRVKMVILGLKQYTVHYTTNLISKDDQQERADSPFISRSSSDDSCFAP